MALLFAFLLFQLTNAQKERGTVYLGRGYDVIKGNPFILRPGDGAASGLLIDPGMKPAKVFTISGLNLNVLKEMFPNVEDWEEGLRKNAIIGDYRTGEGKYPVGTIFLYNLTKCVAKQLQVSKDEKVLAIGVQQSSSDELTIDGVTEDFRRTVCELPDYYTRDNAKYENLLSSFGTSVVIGTKLGTMYIERHQAEPKSIKEQIRFGDPVLRHNQTTQMYVRITDELLHKIDPKSFKDKHSDKVRWAIGNEYNLSPVELSVWNLDEVIHEDYWPNCLSHKHSQSDENQPVDGCCSRLKTLKDSVKLALIDYPRKLNIHIHNDTDVFYHVTWPSGTYSLYQTGSGCPMGTGFQWRHGFLRHKQDEATNIKAPPGVFPRMTKMLKEQFSLHRKSRVSATFISYLLTQRFCTKSDDGAIGYESSWPAGSYCIYKYGKCPQGFKEGWVFWDDIGKGLLHEKGGVYPDGVYDGNTQIYFCCRKDGPASHPIILPVQEPFILMRIGGKCQTVQWTKVTEASIYFDGDWASSLYPLSHFVGGLYPDNNMVLSDNKLYYCYYKYIS